MTKREKIKFYIFLLIFVPAAIFVISGEISTYKTTGCVGFLQEARPRFEKMPRGVPFTADEVEYTCSWNKKKIGISLGASLIIAGSALQKWEKIKPKKQSNTPPPT